MHTWHVIAFLLLVAATVLACTQRSWTSALLAGGLAAFVLPIAFELTR